MGFTRCRGFSGSVGHQPLQLLGEVLDQHERGSEYVVRFGGGRLSQEEFGDVQPVRARSLRMPLPRHAVVRSGEKFDSGTGWPSFTQPVAANSVAYNADNSHGLRRIEAVCNTCDAHLGHVFPDGPAPSGLRYCINAGSLCKVEKAEQAAG